MKSTALDYVISGSLICLLLAASLGLASVLVPLTRTLLADYHVLADAAIVLLVYGLLSALAVKLLLWLRPIPPGSHADDSAAFANWKLVTVTYRLGQGALHPFVPFFARHLLEKLFGAHIGSNVACGGAIDDPYLLWLGDGSVLGFASLVSGNYLSEGKLVCGPVRIGSRVTIGANAIVMPGTTIGDGATVTSGACVMPGTTIPAGETWRGNPARKWM